MAKLAYLGPEWTFSHDLARSAFPKLDHLPQAKLSDVVESVATGKCNVGLIPFYNTTRLSIEESQIELVKHLGKVFVSDVLKLEVKHHMGGFGTTNAISKLRSKIVVFHQVSTWLQKQPFKSALRVDYSSTSAAIKSLHDDGKPQHEAAIGTLAAFKNYKVPVLARNIQNDPNVTLFFTIQNQAIDLQSKKRVVMCINKAQTQDKKSADEIVSVCGCSISSNWAVTLTSKPLNEAYFFEIDGSYSSLGLMSAVARLKSELKNAFVLGGYTDKCITRLLWVPK